MRVSAREPHSFREGDRGVAPRSEDAGKPTLGNRKEACGDVVMRGAGLLVPAVEIRAHLATAKNEERGLIHRLVCSARATRPAEPNASSFGC